MSFAENLKKLPGISHLAAVNLLDKDENLVATIENKPGKSGSLTLYAALAAKHGSINVAAAQEGLELFAEHTADARAHPGSHPNVDRLFDVINSGQALAVKLIPV